MSRPIPDISLKPKRIAASVAACFALYAVQPQANPTGPTVVHGSVGFSGLGTSALTITNQAGGNAIINWNGFSIGASELTRFQQFANLAVLNRVTGSELSSILGALQSDGRVFLINPNGIVFGASARVDVAGLVASSLNLSDQDFLANRLRFTEVPGAGAVVNNGVIQTQAGGRVYLVAPTVENNGLVQAPGGEIVLAAGKEVELVDGDFPLVTVKVAADADSALNVGNLVADGGRIGMFGPLVRNAGTVSATAAVAGPGGEIRLVAAKDVTLDAGSVTAANGASGGKVLLQAQGGTSLIGGTVEAKGSAGAGGQVDALGLRVGLAGHGIIDASGDTAGGTVRVGGDYQGKNAAVQNAERTYIGADGVIRADAATTGDGGRVIVWADGDTRFYGSISARGGAQGGNGGFVETSGKQALAAAGSVSTAAPNGAGGTWLLDPDVINVDTIGADDGALADGQVVFGEPPSTASISVYGIQGAMAGGSNVVLQANSDINLQTDVNTTAYTTRSLTMAASQNINLSFYNVSTGGDLTLSAGNQITGSTSGNSLQSVNGSVTLSGTANTGALDILAGAGISTGAINASSYDSHVYMAASAGSITTGPITTSPAGDGFSSVTLDAQAGAVTVNGAITTGGMGSAQVVITASTSISTGNVTTGDSFQRFIAMNAGSGSISTGSLVTRGQAADSSAGTVSLSAPGSITVNGTIDARGANGAYGSVLAGGAGADVNVNSGGAVSIGSIDNSGGAGASPGTVSFADASGGSGGYAGGIFVYGGSVSVGAIASRGGAGASGGTASTASYGALGGSGGGGGYVSISAPSGGVSVNSIDTSGGAAGNGGATDGGNANGGDGGGGGTVYVDAAGISIGTIVSRGGKGGNGGAGSGNNQAEGEVGGWGGWVNLYASTGSISVGSIDLTGGAGGAGGLANNLSQGPTDASGGDGGEGGYASASAPLGIGIGSFVSQGGTGGAGGTASGGDPAQQLYTEAQGGDGGGGGSLYLYRGAATLGTLNLLGAQGGAGGSSMNASGGNGGSGGYVYAELDPGNGITAGAIHARGGDGGAGGIAETNEGDSSGGPGGWGGSAYLITGAGAGGPITTGMVDVSGGNGGNSGPVGTTSSTGGAGGSGGSASYYGSAVNVAGPIFARGGNGGQMVNSSILSALAGTPDGGAGGYGGYVSVQGTELVKINVGGTLGAVAIDVSGGAGGNGHPAASPAGNGGAGGSGGSTSVVATPDMTLFGSVLAGGGAGGAGGSGSASVPGGAGGSGGSAGAIFLDASSVTSSQTGDGIIFVLAGTQFNVQGGAGGAGGANLGAGAGAGGAAGSSGTFISMSDYFGTIVVLDPLSVPEINSAYQQLVEGADKSTVVVEGEDEDEDEDKTGKEFGACKG